MKAIDNEICRDLGEDIADFARSRASSDSDALTGCVNAIMNIATDYYGPDEAPMEVVAHLRDYCGWVEGQLAEAA